MNLALGWQVVLGSAMCVLLRTFGVIALAGAPLVGASAVEAQEQAGMPEAANAELDRARALINSPGDGAQLDRAREQLEDLLRRYPTHARVHRELAGYYLVKGYVNRGTYKPEYLEAAALALGRAIEARPDYAEAFVVRGFVHLLEGETVEAHAALDRAQSLGTNDPWLLLNRARLLLDERRIEESYVVLQELQDRNDLEPGPAGEVQALRRRYLIHAGRKDEADRLFRQGLDAEPDDHWAWGNYAMFQLCHLDDYQGSLQSIKRARALSDYGIARSIHGAALYRRWADEVAEESNAVAEATFAEAIDVSGLGPAAALNVTCRGGAMTSKILDAMRRTGKGERVPAAQAVLLAGEGRKHDVVGLFVVPVRSTGKSGADVFLGSEDDYRDPKNLAVRVTPGAQREIEDLYGGDPLTMYEGMTLEVEGWIERVRIDFRQNGVPTGKFYYQTHLVVDRADQIAVIEGKPAL